MRDIKTIDKELHDLNETLISTRNKYEETYKERIEVIQEKLRPLVGKCFKDSLSPAIFIVTKVPEVEFYKSGQHFNPYQIPIYALTIDGEDKGLYSYETVYSKACDAEDAYKEFIRLYREISLEEFFDLAQKTIYQVVHDILGGKQ